MGYRPIDYQPLDFTGLGDIATRYIQGEKSAQDAKRASAAEERAKFEVAHRLEREQRQDEIDKTQQLYPNSPLMRAAAKNPALGNQLGKPYGISFDNNQPPPDTSMDAPVTPDVAKEAQFLLGGAQPAAETAIPFPAKHDYSDSPLADDPRGPLQGPTPSGQPLNEHEAQGASSAFLGPGAMEYAGPMQGPTRDGSPLSAASSGLRQEPDPPPAHADDPGGDAPPFDIDAALAKRSPTTRSVFATVAGQRFEIPETNDTPFNEEKYDTMYQRLLQQGNKPEVAEAKVLTMRGQDLLATGRAGTLGVARDALEQKKNTQLTREEVLGDHEANRGQSDINNRRNNAAKIAAAKLIGMGMNEKTAVSVIGQYRQYDDSAQRQALMKQDQQGMRLEDRIAMELDPDNPNALNHQMATHSLAALSVSTGSGGARVPVSVIHDVQNAYSLATSWKNRLYKETHGGQNSPEVVAVMNDARGKLKALSTAQRESDFRVWDHKAGYGSAWARHPATRGLVDSSRAAVREQLHLAPEEETPNLETLTDPYFTDPIPGGEPPPIGPAQPRPDRPRAKSPVPGGAKPPTKVVGGKTYYKVQGGWTDTPPGQ